MLKRNFKGITLLETFLASFIFVISVSAIFGSIISLRRPAVNNEQEVGAALVGKKLLEELRSKVDTRDMVSGVYSGDLEEGSPNCGTSPQIHCRTDGIYQVTWEVLCVDSSDVHVGCAPNVLRKVTATVTWSDAIP